MKRLFLLAIALLLVSCQNFPASTLANARTCTVVRGSVHDGDTIRVDCQGEQKKIGVVKFEDDGASEQT
ncbi:hypothetical protein [Microcystis aeruginosa]|uniref:Thermonuclease family protein n=1 Tax=Microcystis aeruginosa 11-30S32 TaxID=2358142 RepID=A0A510PPU3_MICAE|nr:hypothetical protein [Microcystis aeruginosa]GCA95834.1 thermonuclease family protein [Microcystis aeruginosa 11-30S32]